MANEVQIIIKAIDKASSEFKKVNTSMTSLSTVMQSAGTAVGIFTGILAATGGAAIKAANGAREYILAMSDMALKAGTTVDEMSRIVQIADDLRVSQESLATAFRFMSDQGIQPTLENLAALSDKFLTIQDPVRRAQFAMETFGARGGLEMVKMLDVGGDALEEMGTKVDEFVLVVSEADRQTTQAYFNMQDNFADMTEGLKKEAGTITMPVLTSLMGGVMATKGAFDDWLSGDAYPPTLFRIAQAVAKAGAEWRNQQAALAGNVEEVGFLRVATWGIVEANRAIPSALSEAEQAFKDLTSSTVEGYLKNLEYKAGVDDIAAAIAALRDKSVTINVTTVTEEVTAQTWKWRKDLNTGGPGGPQMAGGADFIVPPGYPNDSFPMRAQSGERVQVTPAGETARSGANVTINVSSTPMDVQWITKQLKSAVGM
jgi:hypothetical protein